MIDPVCSSMSAATTSKNGGVTPDDGISDLAFLQILDALVEATAGLGSPGKDNSAVVSMGATDPFAAYLSAKIGSTTADGNVETVFANGCPGRRREGGSPSAAIEMVQSLLSTLALHLQPWQLKVSAKATSTRGVRDPKADPIGGTVGGLVEELLAVPPSGRNLFLLQALAHASALLGEESKRPSQQALRLLGASSPEASTLEEIVAALRTKAVRSSSGHSQTAEASVRDEMGTDIQRGDEAFNAGARLASDHDGRGEPGTKSSQSNRPIVQAIVATQKAQEKQSFAHDRYLSGQQVPEIMGVSYVSGDAQTADLTLNRVYAGASEATTSTRVSDGSYVPPPASVYTGASGATTASASVVEQIARRAHLIVARGQVGLSIQLEPEELGTVRVQVSMGSRGLHVKLATEASDAKEIIQSSLPQLKAAFESQGLKVDRFDVAVASSFSAFGSLEDDARWQGLNGSHSPERYLLPDDVDVEGAEKLEVGRSNSLVDYRI